MGKLIKQMTPEERKAYKKAANDKYLAKLRADPELWAEFRSKANKAMRKYYASLRRAK
jgi:hypothetical protein